MTIKLTKDDVEIEVYAEWEQERPERFFDSEEDVALVQSRIDADNEWGWASVFVVAIWDGFYMSGESAMRRGDIVNYPYLGYDVLGAVSAEDEDDFIENHGYYDGMVDLAIEDLNRRINAIPVEELANSLIEDSEYSEEGLAEIADEFDDLRPYLI